ncbi:uncharacterized protein M421DRAFT_405441 [Didymella exigua CBS 183.55]|uniref:Uncharacterized protein n=1 Tax=Didymella exigua CBS 183.55 TaxID=1150837 RepID=A0A6A5R743_9PLEO|nr:uncharacterized protein M421DRAFT_405441 [Didymella exigua CBS 183.55]KAF1923552.1 hypothetical protein M421DRAFT_405441 [Didymella exigua CBS 183.55]
MAFRAYTPCIRGVASKTLGQGVEWSTEKRREVEGDCFVCYKELRAGVDEPTFCVDSCGANFHWSSLQDWKEQTPVAATRCPLYQHVWNDPTFQQQSLPDVSERNFYTYSNWLYRSEIMMGGENTNVCYNNLVESYVTGQALHDEKFCKSVLRAFVELCVDDRRFPGSAVIQMAYAMTSGPCSLRWLLIGLYMRLDLEEACISFTLEKQPVQLLRGLSFALLEESPT